MPVIMVRNEMAGSTVLSSDIKGTHWVEWQGKGDPNGGDIQPVPQEIVDTVPYGRALRLGVLTVIDETADGEAESADALERQQQAFDLRQGVSAAVADDAIDRQANQDFIVQPCVGPAARGVGTCDIDVSVKDVARDKRPPLCNLHVNLASTYIPEEVTIDGKPGRRWTRVTMGARERQQ